MQACLSMVDTSFTMTTFNLPSSMQQLRYAMAYIILYNNILFNYLNTPLSFMISCPFITMSCLLGRPFHPLSYHNAKLPSLVAYNSCAFRICIYKAMLWATSTLIAVHIIRRCFTQCTPNCVHVINQRVELLQCHDSVCVSTPLQTTKPLSGGFFWHFISTHN